jgi:hypothetical protein
MRRTGRLLALIVMMAGVVVLAQIANSAFGVMGLIVVVILGLLVTAATLRL